jgi:hypothetical protein
VPPIRKDNDTNYERQRRKWCALVGATLRAFRQVCVPSGIIRQSASARDIRRFVQDKIPKENMDKLVLKVFKGKRLFHFTDSGGIIELDYRTKDGNKYEVSLESSEQDSAVDDGSLLLDHHSNVDFDLWSEDEKYEYIRERAMLQAIRNASEYRYQVSKSFIGHIGPSGNKIAQALQQKEQVSVFIYLVEGQPQVSVFLGRNAQLTADNMRALQQCEAFQHQAENAIHSMDKSEVVTLQGGCVSSGQLLGFHTKAPTATKSSACKNKESNKFKNHDHDNVIKCMQFTPSSQVSKKNDLIVISNVDDEEEGVVGVVWEGAGRSPFGGIDIADWHCDVESQLSYETCEYLKPGIQMAAAAFAQSCQDMLSLNNCQHCQNM